MTQQMHNVILALICGTLLGGCFVAMLWAFSNSKDLKELRKNK